MTPSLVASDETDDNFLGLFYCVDVQSLNDWPNVTPLTRASIDYVVQEPDVTEDFKHFPFIIYGSNWEKKILAVESTIIEQHYALITGYGKLTSCMKRIWMNEFNSGLQIRFGLKLRSLPSPEAY